MGTVRWFAVVAIMVTVRGGGETYQISSGKVMTWEEVPDWFKEAQSLQQEEPACMASKAVAQKCIADNGFWHSTCTALTDAFHLCQANELRKQLPPQKPIGH